MARPRGPNRNFPALTLEKALKLPRTLQEGASGMKTDRLTLSELLNNSPSSSLFVQLVLASRAYGLTTGGKNADEFGLTDIGRLAVSNDLGERQEGLRRAVLSIEPFKRFFTAYDRKKVPLPAAFKSYLTSQAAVPAEHAQEAIDHLLADARLAGLLRSLKGSDYVDLQGGAAAPPSPTLGDDDDAPDELPAPETGLDAADPSLRLPPPPKQRPSAIFLGHGKNKKPLDQLTKMLGEYKIPFKIAVDEPNQGRPISQKVADVMDECGAAILIFTADRELKDAEGNTIWQPSENVVFELGAAAVKYGSRIVIFKEESVDFPTNFRDIGHISFEKDQLEAKAVDLFRELIAFGLLTLSVAAE